jgi:hypothetical protein
MQLDLNSTAVTITAFLQALPDDLLVRDPSYPCHHALQSAIRDGLVAAVKAALGGGSK